MWFKQFAYVHDITNTMTRQKNKLYVAKTKTDAGARNFDVIGPKLWNRLSSDITDANSVTTFKSRLINHIHQRTPL